MELLENCKLCPRNCGVNRLSGKRGFCGAGDKIRVARAALHYWEEPCISGDVGSGTVFFSHCTLKCVFCQNYNISQCEWGKEITVDRLAEIFIELQNKGALNINLVTPTHYVPQIIEAISISRKSGLKLPIIYNSSGYEKVETIKLLKGYIDVYLPDMKYFDTKYSIRYSKAKDYFKYAKEAINEMVNQVGEAKFNERGIIQKGVIVRHLMLPGLLFDSKKIIEHIHNMYGNKVYISIMNQYTPLEHVKAYPELNKSLNEKHYDSMIDYALSIGVENGFIQEEGTDKESFIPLFNFEGV
ncbi:radical SAM protein [Clostridium sp. DSM 100503]|uniref:radical SAM protein n=1 Tax=Clostridium sp. DSM 100503 TaxID=2963282 RepID=UPI00214A41B2|nr:radical SAM protein [Clostridium sp. DSM 100503]MCR1952238.1 radical SAM protein [Clostridium sp. DSM 100503]